MKFGQLIIQENH